MVPVVFLEIIEQKLLLVDTAQVILHFLQFLFALSLHPRGRDPVAQNSQWNRLQVKSLKKEERNRKHTDNGS
jgi:hypothetical protein